MKFGFNFGLLGSGGGSSGPIPNGCVTQGTNGTEYGYDKSIPIGDNIPDIITATGQVIYANYWLADGTFIMQFGDIGNEPIPDVEFIFTVINGTLLQYVWQPDTLLYEASNPTLATQLIADYVEGEDVCYTALPILQKFISYDMNITDVDGTNTLINNTAYKPHFNAVAQGSNHVWLNGTDQSVDLPINYEFGDELITNGDFDTDTDWTKGSGWTISGGQAHCDGTQGSTSFIQQDNVLVVDEEYYIKLEVTSIAAGTVSIALGLAIVATFDTVGTHFITGSTSAISRFALQASVDFIGSIDSVSVSDELLNTNSYATYYDVDTKAFKSIGQELLVNGDFSVDDGWTKGTGWTISGGTANTDGTVSNFTSWANNTDIEVGRSYIVSFDTSGTYAGSGLSIRLGDLSANLYNATVDGNHSFTTTVTSSSDGLRFRVGVLNDFIGSVDNVSVREALTVGTTYNITDSFSSYFTTDVPVTEADRSYLNTNPEALYAMWFGEPVVGLSFSKANMINFIPGTEGLQGGAYLQDLSVDLGTDLNDTADPVLNNASGGATVDYTTVAFDSFSLAVTSIGTVNTYPRVTKNLLVNMPVGTDYIFSFNAVVNGGIPILRAVNIGGQINTIYTIINGVNNIRLTSTVDNATSGLLFDGRELFDIEVTDWTVKEVTVYEITNYLDTCRTTLANTNYGASNFAMVQDGSGRVTGMGLANTQNFPPYDDGRYASTGFKPSIPVYSIEETVTGELQDFGSDVVVNGTFDTDISGWSTSGGTSVWSSDNGGSMETTPSGTTALIYQSVPTSTAQWLVTFKIKSGISLSSVNVRTGAVSESIGTYTNTGNYETYTHIIFSNSTYDYIQIGSIGGSTASEPIYFDDVTMEELTTKTQRTEARLLTHTDAIPETKYYINGVLQDVTPALPDPAVTMSLDRVAKIGYPDTIQRREADFNVHTEILVPEIPVNAVYHNGEAVTHDGELVTHTN